MTDIKLPRTPSMNILEMTTSGPIDVEEMEEPSGRLEEDSEQKPYAPNWMIYPGMQLIRLLVPGKWVARVLPPAKMEAYSGAQLFDICDTANRAVVLVSFFWVDR